MRRTKPLILHPFLFAVYPILFMFSRNMDEVALNDLVRPVLIALALAVVGFVFFRLLLRDAYKAALLVTIAVLMFILYGPIWDLICRVEVRGIVIGRQRTLLMLYGIIYLVAVFLVARTRARLETATSPLNAFAVILTSLVVLGVLFGVWKSQANKSGGNWKAVATEQCKAESQMIHPEKPLRDIYYIIFDEYTRNDVLQDYYGYDNSGFIKWLEDKGFYVASESQSNYWSTHYSLAESLNFDDLASMMKSADTDSADHKLLGAMICHNKTCRLLKDVGYKFVLISSGWQITERNSNADMTLPPNKHNLSEFERAILLNSPLHAFVIGTRRSHALNSLQALESIPKIKEPTFTFAHIPLPHEPPIFDRNGNVPKVSRLNKERLAKGKEPLSGTRKLVVDQFIYTNKRAMGIVDKILAEPGVKPIIIIQGDHGYRPGIKVLDEMAADSGMPKDKVEAERMRIRLGILNAYYLPDGGNKLLYPTISPINSFRIVFNRYFGAHYKLKDKFIPVESGYSETSTGN